jgi:hypothetical protein
VKVLDYKQETLDKKPVETVVLPYVGFDSGIPLDVRRISFEISGMYWLLEQAFCTEEDWDYGPREGQRSSKGI